MVIRRISRSWLLVALAVSLGMAGCAPREDAEAPRRAVIEVRDTAADPEPIVGAQMGENIEPGDTFPETFRGTAGIVAESRSGIGPAILQEVRTASHTGFDRVVFEFDGISVPGYHIEYVDRPVRECGSGHTVPVAGDGWLRVRLEPTRAHEFIGERAEVTVENRDRSYDYPILKQLTLICDFEAQVEWVLGVSSPNRFRVIELHEPARLVVDVRH
ncbi:MAG: hypothetical protein M3418_02590 [Gemmatimonadota bacterium]|nr:hypothetical protein [Gemmatimonadota bacterium]